ncbi:MAG: hypothetical protein AAB869_02770, partial [Patescibacteria group bacterium]
MLTTGAIAIISAALFETLGFLTFVGVTVGIFGLLGLYFYGEDKWGWHLPSMSMSLSKRTTRFVDNFFVVLAIVTGLAVTAAIGYVALYLPIASLLELGYTLLAAIGIYLGTLLLLPVPAYCLGGKKLLLKTE